MSITVDPGWWKSLFDETYLKTDARSVCDDSLTHREVDVFREMIPLRTDQHILDLCGGHGRHSIELCRRGFRHCTVLDYSRPLLMRGLTQAKKHSLPLLFIQSDARKSPLAGESFQHVLVLGNSLGYASGGEPDLPILTEARRILKPDGWILVDVTDGSRVRENFSANAWHEIEDDILVCRQRQLRGSLVYVRELVVSKSGGMIRDRTYRLRLYEANDLKCLLNRAGFWNIRVRTRFTPIGSDKDVGFMNSRMIATAQK
jgi:D-alanine-D-alanine ligase